MKSFLKGYLISPISLIGKVIKSFLDNIFSSVGKKPKTNEDKPNLLSSTPFPGPGSLHLKSRISRLIKQCYPGYELRIFSTPKSIYHFLPFKDSIPTLPRASLVYCFKCPSCNARYCGKISCKLAIRCREHIGVTKTGYKINNNSSAIYNHSSTNGHPVSLEEVIIISRVAPVTA